MRSTFLAVGVLGLVGAISACGDDRPDNADLDGNGARSGSGGKSNNAGKANADPGGAGGDDSNENGPVVRVTTPTASASPDDGVLTGETLHVVCSATASAQGVAVVDTSVSISLEDSAGKIVEQKATATANRDEYEADLVIATAAPGSVSITCTAHDSDAVKGTATISSFLDHGPKISVLSPLPDSAHTLKGGLDVTFLVEAVPLAETDSGAEIGRVTFALDGRECVVGDAKCEVTEVTPGKYHADLAFPIAASGAITITAVNERTPKPVTATTSYSIIIDGDGPVIAIESPSPQQVVGGKVTLVFTATDAEAGVDPETVSVALFPNAPRQFFDPENGWSRQGNRYTHVFDSKLLEKDAPVQTTINVRASDKVGNPSASGQSLQLYLDNVPPKVDLDPKNIRAYTGTTCSGSFDPVGDYALNDLAGETGSEIVNPIAFFRAFIDEETNSQPGQKLFYHAGTDQAQVRLYIQPDPENQDTKLLVNRNPAEDNTCDDIGGLDDLGNGPPFSALNPINATSDVGSVWNKADHNEDPQASDTCTQEGVKPELLCPSHKSDMWYVPFNYPIKEPFVYVVGTPMPDDSCTGIDLAFLTTNQPDGWVCAAARAVDKAGNVGISPPLRICVDDGKGTVPPCRISSTIPPTCTDGCTPPPRGGGRQVLDQ